MPQKSKSPSRKSHKRRASAASIDAHSRDSSLAPNDPSQSTPQKRQRKSRKHSVTGSVVSTQEPLSPHTTVTTKIDRHRKVRLSEPGPSVNYPSLPPQIETSRRATLSPRILSTNGDDVSIQFTPLTQVFGLDDRTRRRLKRNHLSEETNSIYEHKRRDARNEREMEELRRKIPEKDQQIKDLEWELEQQRLSSVRVDEEDPVEIQRLVAEVEATRRELDELKAAESKAQLQIEEEDALMDQDEAFDEYDDDDTNMQTLVASDPPVEDVASKHSLMTVSKTTKTTTTLQRGLSEITFIDPMREVEIREFEQQITALNRSIADKNAALENITTELRAIGFSQQNADSILVEIRTEFTNARGVFDSVFPGDDAINLKNGDFLRAVMDRIRSTKEQIEIEHEQFEKVIQQKKALLGSNIQLIDKVKELDTRKKTLEKQWHDMDIDREAKDKDILELGTEISDLEETLKQRDEDLVEKDQTIAELQMDVENQEVGKQRLNDALNKYYDERNTMELLIAKLEADLEESKQETTETNQELDKVKASYAEQVSFTQTAEQDAVFRQSIITSLELELEKARSRIEELDTELTTHIDQGNQEREKRVLTEKELADEQTANTSLGEEIDAANKEIEELQHQVDSLKEDLAAEITEHNDAEADVEERNDRIAQLQLNMQKLGQEANELKSKIFSKDKKIEEREEQYQQDMAAEIERREQAEEDARVRQAKVEELGNTIREITAAKINLETEKSEVIASQAEQLDAMEDDLVKTQSDLEAALAEKEAHIVELEDKIKDLEDTIFENNADMDRLRTASRDAEELHQATITQKNAELNELASTLSDTRMSLEQANSTTKQYEETVEEERTTYRTLQTHTTSLEAENADLRKKLAFAKNAYADLKEDSQRTLASQENEVRSTVSRIENGREGFMARITENALKMDELEIPDWDENQLGTPAASTQEDYLHGAEDELATTKKVKKTKRTRALKTKNVWRDSGFGAEEEDEIAA